MGAAKILEGKCVQGTDVMWIALNGFIAGLVLLVAGMEYLTPDTLTSILAVLVAYLAYLGELTQHPTLQEWMPLTGAVAAVAAVSMGGSRIAKGESFFPPTLASGLFPVIFLSALGGHVLGAFQLMALKSPGIEEWMPLTLAAAGVGLLAASGARYGNQKTFFPSVLTEGVGPRAVMLTLAFFTSLAFVSALEGKKGQWEQWIGLAVSAGFLGLMAQGGARYAAGGDFFASVLASGPVPAAIMAILGAYIYTSLNNLLFKDTKKGLDDWLPLAGAASGVGLLALGGSRIGSGKPFFPEVLIEGPLPKGFLLVLAAFVTLSFHSTTLANDPKGGLTTWTNLLSAAAAVGAISFVGKKIGDSGAAATA